MKQLIAFFVTTVLLVSCGSNKIPANILSTEQMGILTWQLMQADEYINTLIAKDSTKKSSTERMKIYQQVFELNKTTEEQFKKSYQFYIEHPDIGKGIFDSMTVRAGRERIELMRTKPDTLALKADSIRRKRLADSLARMGGADSLHVRPGAVGKGLLRADSVNTLQTGTLPKKRTKKTRPLIHQ